MPLPEDYEDADGHIDYEEYDYAWSIWQSHIEFERNQLPDLGECWCGEDVNIIAVELTPENIPSLHDLLSQLLGA
jgi:hypothetical protein